MAKKDKKSKSAEQKQRKTAKQEKKTSKTAAKATKKSKNGDPDSSDDESVDLDAVLASYAAAQQKFLTITETPLSEPPHTRTAASFLANPQNGREILLFGGEYYDGSLARFYNDLLVYHTKHDTWSSVTSPNSPLPRSGHTWCTHANSKTIYLFGGEFSSPKQGTFYHYGDFWSLNPTSREWTRIETKGKSPTSRSGHRMTSWKGYVVLFGGFRDTAGGTTYLNDVWLFDVSKSEWFNPVPPPGSARPDARSSCSLLPHEQGAALVGGYSRVKTAVKGAKGTARTLERPVVHQDAWYLRVSIPDATGSAAIVPTIRWEKRKRPANAPQPARAGATMVPHKGRGILFGGVWDTEASEEGIDSEFFNGLWVWNVDRNRWFELKLRRPRKRIGGPEKATGRKDKAKRDEEELLAQLKALEADDANGSGVTEIDAANEDNESDEEAEKEKPLVWEMPHVRFNTMLAIQDDIIYIYGGTFEKGDKEFTFDEMWRIDLGKLDGCRELFRRDVLGSIDDEVEEDEDEEDEDEAQDSDDDDDDDDENSTGRDTESTAPSLITDSTTVASESENLLSPSSEDFEEAEAPDTKDTRPYPRPFESLRQFFARTSQAWQELLLQESNANGDQGGKSVKEVRKKAFDLAEEKWWDAREDIQALEDEQEEAGIGEIVDLREKGNTGLGGAGRRR